MNGQNAILVALALPLVGALGIALAGRISANLREAVTQLRREAGERQVVNADTALIGCGGFFFNSQGAFLRRL